MATPYSECPNQVVSAANGVDYVYRELGDGAVPLVLLQHFRGNLDYWDPPLVDALAAGRRLILFDNAGVGGSSGTTPSTVAADGEATPSRSSPRWTSIGSTSSGTRSGASSRRRSP